MPPQCDMMGTSCCPGSPTNIIDEIYSRMMKDNPRRHHLSKLPQPKRVSFAENAVLYWGDVTADEALSGWYSVEDYQGFKMDRKEAIRMIKKNGFNIYNIESAGHCLRGFEPYFSLEINRRIRHVRETAVRNVLREQQRQIQLGSYDDEAMRVRYAQATQWTHTNAIQMGTNDAALVRDDELRQLPMNTTASPRGVTKSIRNEFVQTAALHRERSTRQLRLEEEANLETRHTTGIMKKLENALQLVGKIV
jgi:hypothetical protein